MHLGDKDWGQQRSRVAGPDPGSAFINAIYDAHQEDSIGGGLAVSRIIATHAFLDHFQFASDKHYLDGRYPANHMME